MGRHEGVHVFVAHCQQYVSPAGFGGRRRRCTHFTYDNASDEFTQTQVTVGPHAAPPVELHPEQGILASPDADDSEASDD